MARITIEDCMEHVPNRFHLVRMASIRAKQLKKGALPLLTSEDNKQIVMSLREIAAGLVKAGDAEASSVEAAQPDVADPSKAGMGAAEEVRAEEVPGEEVSPEGETDESAGTSEG